MVFGGTFARARRGRGASGEGLYRTRSGKPALHDAFCPHLGAHLGHEGRVIGETIRCPFHGWQFNAEDGKCSSIPYCDEIPERARIRTWHVDEKNGEVYVWFHPENTGPQWALPDLPELGDPNWTSPRYTEHLVLSCAGRYSCGAK